jgi:hypothetical protein
MVESMCGIECPYIGLTIQRVMLSSIDGLWTKAFYKQTANSHCMEAPSLLHAYSSN